MGKLIVELPDELHGRLKKKATVERRTLKDVVTTMILEYLSEKEKKQHLKETGLCGKWEDERTAGEIIKDIRVHRRWTRVARI